MLGSTVPLVVRFVQDLSSITNLTNQVISNVSLLSAGAEHAANLRLIGWCRPTIHCSVNVIT